jgi:aminobenzoyl-glutamate utilization protein B
MNKPMAEAAAANMAKVGLPQWDAADQALAHAVQKSIASDKQEGLATKLTGIELPKEKPLSGGSDDIGDISWIMPTITIRYPANIPGLPGHNWANAISMATPIAHKGIVTGSKVMAMTLVDLFVDPALLPAAKAFFADVQTKTQKYQPVLTAKDKPMIGLNAATMAEFRPAMSKFYYDEKKYPSYLEQLGIKWPSVPVGK